MKFGRSRHRAKYSAVGVCFTYAFSLPPGSDIDDLANRLLDTGVADVAAVAPSTTMRVSRRQLAALRARDTLEGLSNIAEVADGKISTFRWVFNNPRAAAFAFRRRVLRFSLSSNKAGRLSSSDRTNLSSLRESVAEIDAAMAENAKVLGAAAATDEFLFSPIYLRKGPFIRLELGNLGATSRLLADETIIPILVLHRSGVALLTFYTVVGSNRSSVELVRASVSKTMTLTSTTFPIPVVGVGEIADQVARTDELLPDGDSVPTHRRIEWADDFSIADAFFVYRDRICELAGERGGRVGDYFCYATLAIGGIACCGTRDRWLKSHSDELAGLILRYDDFGDIGDATTAKVLQADRSIQRSSSRYYNGGNAVTVDWNTDETEYAPSFVSLLDTVAIIENAVLQYWQIQELDNRLDLSERRASTLTKIQLRLAEGIAEHRSSTISFGGAQDIVADILAKLNVGELHQRVVDRLAMNQQLVDVRKVDASVRRNYLIAGIGSFATVLLGIPAIRDSLSVIAQWKPPPFIVPAARPLIEWAKGGANAIILMYAGFLFLATLLLVANFIRRPKRWRRRRLVGLEWDSTKWRRQPPVSNDGSPDGDQPG